VKSIFIFILFALVTVFWQACSQSDTSHDFAEMRDTFIDTLSDKTSTDDVLVSGNESIMPVYGEEMVHSKIKLNAIITGIKFSPEGDKFVSVSNDNIIRLWDLQGNLLAVMKGHSESIGDVNFSPDGQLIASGSLDKTARLWDLSGKELMVYTGYGDEVGKVRFSPDGKYILTSSYDHTARLMPISLEIVLDKINTEKVRGEVWQLSEQDKEVYGIDTP